MPKSYWKISHMGMDSATALGDMGSPRMLRGLKGSKNRVDQEGGGRSNPGILVTMIKFSV